MKAGNLLKQKKVGPKTIGKTVVKETPGPGPDLRTLSTGVEEKVTTPIRTP